MLIRVIMAAPGRMASDDPKQREWVSGTVPLPAPEVKTGIPVFFGERRQLGPCIGIPDATAGDDHGIVRRSEELRCLADPFAVHRLGKNGRLDLSHFGRVNGRIEHVAGKLQINGAGPAAHGGPEGHVNKFGDPFGHMTDPGFFDHGLDDGKLAHILKVQFFRAFQAYTSCNKDHRSIGEPRTGDPRTGHW